MVTLLAQGLPKLQTCKSFTAPVAQSTYRIDEAIFDKTFNILTEFEDIEGLNLGGITSRTLLNKERLEARSEDDIKWIVIDVMKDLIDGCRLSKTVTIFSELTTRNLRPDILVVELRDRLNSPLCCIEVKTPSKDAIDNLSALGQLYSYMMQLRTLHGRNEVFGILTSYEEWRIVWFPDMDVAAASETPDYVNSTPIVPNSRILHCTKLIHYDDLLLSKMLMSLLVKSTKSHCFELPLYGVERAYMVMSSVTSPTDLWEIKTFGLLSLHPPKADAKQFYVLRDFKTGVDGRSWLACSKYGKLAVLKFILPVKDGLTASKLADEECKKWLNVFDVKDVRKVEMYGHPTVTMPFVFTSRPSVDGEDGGEQVFKPVLSPHATDGENCLVERNVAHLLAESTPAAMAREAIKTLVDHGFIHRDVHWRHVGALPVWTNKTLVRLKGVFIDLSNVPTLASLNLSKESAEEEMLSRLNLEILPNES